MLYKQTTQVPNVLFDKFLPELTDSELRVLLVIIRQTFGWINPKTGKRKTRDRISYRQFMTKAGLSRRVISNTVKTLESKGLISITDGQGVQLQRAADRRGKPFLYYALTYALNDTNMRIWGHGHMHGSVYNKTNYIKKIETKLNERNPFIRHGIRHINEIIKEISN